MAVDVQAQHPGDGDAYVAFVWATMQGVHELTCAEHSQDGRVPRAVVEPGFEFTEGWLTLADRR